MIDINSFFLNFQSNAATTFASYTQPHRFDDILSIASQNLFNNLVEQFAIDQSTYDKLQPFLKSKNVPITTPLGSPYGLIVTPEDYSDYASMRVFFKGEKGNCSCPDIENEGDCIGLEPENTPKPISEVEVQKVKPFQFASALNHYRLCPTDKKPICCQYDTGFKIAPRTVKIATLDYFRNPAKAHWAYTEPTPGHFIYDAGNSVQIEWNQNALEDLMSEMIGLYAQSTRDGELFQTNQILQAKNI